MSELDLRCTNYCYSSLSELFCIELSIKVYVLPMDAFMCAHFSSPEPTSAGTQVYGSLWAIVLAAFGVLALM